MISVEEQLDEMHLAGAEVQESTILGGPSLTVRYRGGALHAGGPWRHLSVERCWRWFRGRVVAHELEAA